MSSSNYVCQVVISTSCLQHHIAGTGDRAGLRRIQEKLETYIYPQLRTDPHHGLNIKRLKNWEPPTAFPDELLLFTSRSTSQSNT